MAFSGVIDDSLKAYDAAFEKATTGEKPLAPTHPIRLGLALNFSVFHFEIKTDQQKACELAKKVGISKYFQLALYGSMPYSSQ